MVISVNTSAKNLGLGGKIFGSLFLSLFLIMGLFFEVMIVKQTAKNLATFSWTQTEATILSSETQPPRQSDDDPTFHVRYSYIAGGARHESDCYTRDAAAPETSDAYQLAERFTIGKNVPCWVNPRNHAEAVLHRNSPFNVLTVLFPLIFIAIGGGGIWAIWFFRGKKPADNPHPTPLSSRKDTTRTSRLVMVGFFSIFLLVGLGGGYGFFIRPIFQIVAARNWPAIPCEILASRVKSHSDSDGTTYSIDVVYRYTYRDHNYTANRYHFFTGSSSGYEGKAAAVRQYPAGTQRTCYVDPANPSSAVLHRGFTSTLWFGLIPLVFALVGGGGLYAVLRGKFPGTTSSVRPSRSFTANSHPGSSTAVPEILDTPGPQILSSDTSPRAKLIGLVLGALFWNGIVSVFLFNQNWSGLGLLMTLFFLPFVAVGLGLIGGVIYQGMALFNPRPRLTVSRGTARPGETIDLSWDFTGRADRLTRLVLSFEGREEATYRRGTDSATDKEVFARIQLLDTTDPVALHSGSVQLHLPPGAMHTFRSPNNKILWVLKLHGHIPRWPDVKEEYPYILMPGGPNS